MGRVGPNGKIKVHGANHSVLGLGPLIPACQSLIKRTHREFDFFGS